MKHDMIERYIYAATKRLPAKSREDVSMELRGLIDDMLAERCGDETPTEKDIRVVLTELGTPMEVYAKYDEDADKCLIGQPHYSLYKYVLKTMSIPFAVALVFCGIVLQAMPDSLLGFLEKFVGMLVGGMLCAFSAVTLVFAVMYHKGINLDNKFNLDELPSVPKKKQHISRLETGFNIVLLTVLVVVLLVVPRCLAVKVDGGGWIPIFDPDAMKASALAIGLGFVAAITGEFVKLIEARYNRKVAEFTMITNLAQVLCAAWWLMAHPVMNPEFMEKLPMIFDHDNALIQLFRNFPAFLLVVLTLASLAETVVAFVKARQE